MMYQLFHHVGGSKHCAVFYLHCFVHIIFPILFFFITAQSRIAFTEVNILSIGKADVWAHSLSQPCQTTSFYSTIVMYRAHSYQISLVCIHTGQYSRVLHQPVNMTELGTVHLAQ